MRQLYVLSKALNEMPRLIGVLQEHEGQYTFEYKLGGTFPEWFLELDEFPDPCVKYQGEEIDRFIKRLLPPRDSIYIKELLESANLESYVVWEMLKVFGLRNMREDCYLYETLPKGAKLYEQLDDAKY
jgi:hypothetical protein